jgi:hypothetical protein
MLFYFLLGSCSPLAGQARERLQLSKTEGNASVPIIQHRLLDLIPY